MSAIVILLIAVVLLALGYIFYGSWLAKQWGIDPNKETPAHTSYDGKDFVPANPAVLMGHHFSSIAGAGPINGPIQAAVFGWVPVFLWCVLGGIFIGAQHDFGALFASIRHNGASIGGVIKDSMGVKAQRLFTIFALLVLILVIASFTAVVAGTFASDGPVFTTGMANVSAHAATATTSLLFILLAMVFGFFVYRKNAPVGISTVLGVIGVILITIVGLNFGVNASRTFWVLFIAVYVMVASLLPVWILLQPRDYLSSFLLYGMMIIAVVGIVGSGMSVEVPAFSGWHNFAGTSTLFPTLFITVACGACSGFHSLIGSGTTSKQINSEKDAKVIGYGAMIIESALGIISLIAVGVVWSKVQAGDEVMKMSSPPTIFAGGIATMIAKIFGEGTYSVTYTLLSLAVSVFALTSLDSGTRLARYMFAELFIPEGKTRDDLTGAAKFFSNPFVSTLLMVIIGCGMGFMGLSQIWGVFGAANQLLAGIAMLAVATWLGQIGKNNKMFYFPMVFMLLATITSLVMTIITKIKLIAAAGAAWGDWFQMIWSIGLVVLAIILVIEGVNTMKKSAKKA